MKHKRSTMGYTVSCVALGVLFLATIIPSNAQDSVKIKVDSENLKDFEIKYPIVLHCKPELQPPRDNYTLVWSKNGVDVTTIENLQGRLNINSKENQITITKTSDADAGNYTCSLYNHTSVSDTVQVVAKPHVKLPPNTGVIEGEKLKITCLVAGTEPIIDWIINNVTYTKSTDRVELSQNENNITNAVLTIKEAQMSDFGEYICRATNIASNGTQDATYVRVKDKLAALWPFLGICLEVFILCTIILVYEKRRNKPEMEDSDTDQSPDQKK